MKKHAIIPIFIPHKGCPHSCVFCNQRKITAHLQPVTGEDVIQTIETWLTTLGQVETVEIAFFGGSFTAIPIAEQTAYLQIAKSYKDRGLVQKIHLSTRPDAIDREILDNLKAYSVDVIELGVQSFDEEVLRRSERGHSRQVVYDSSRLIQEYGFELGIQLMIGLPGDSLESCIRSAQETVKIGPSIARLYPTIVIRDTELYAQYFRGEYHPLPLDEAISRTKSMYRILTSAGINVIRVGLKSSDLINEDGDIAGATFHPAFRQLVEGEIARESIEAQLEQILATQNGEAEADAEVGPLHIVCSASPRSMSNLSGNGKRNRLFFRQKYPQIRMSYQVDDRLADGVYRARLVN